MVARATPVDLIRLFHVGESWQYCRVCGLQMHEDGSGERRAVSVLETGLCLYQQCRWLKMCLPSEDRLGCGNDRRSTLCGIRKCHCREENKCWVGCGWYIGGRLHSLRFQDGLQNVCGLFEGFGLDFSSQSRPAPTSTHRPLEIPCAAGLVGRQKKSQLVGNDALGRDLAEMSGNLVIGERHNWPQPTVALLQEANTSRENPPT